ncbi:MAG: hypothetical protein Q9161_009669 [Pseudevernia consocians]
MALNALGMLVIWPVSDTIGPLAGRLETYDSVSKGNGRVVCEDDSVSYGEGRGVERECLVCDCKRRISRKGKRRSLKRDSGPPAEIMGPAIEKPAGFGVKDWPATVNTPVVVGVDDSVGSEMVELPVTAKGDISGRDIIEVPPYQPMHEIERELADKPLKLDDKSVENLTGELMLMSPSSITSSIHVSTSKSEDLSLWTQL